MVFDSVDKEERKRFFGQSYGAHLPGYTGHCPTLKFRVGKRFGANTEEIMKELLEKKILKTGPYRPNSATMEQNGLTLFEKGEIRRDWKNETHLFKAPPYILGYTEIERSGGTVFDGRFWSESASNLPRLFTASICRQTLLIFCEDRFGHLGYIPGFNSRYGLSFMRAVEEGGKEWRENQSKLRARRDLARARAERRDSRNLMSRSREDHIAVLDEVDHAHDQNLVTFNYEISPERPPIVGYTGHIPGAKGEVALSKRYAQAAKKGLELIRKEREERRTKLINADGSLNVFNPGEVYQSERTPA